MRSSISRRVLIPISLLCCWLCVLGANAQTADDVPQLIQDLRAGSPPRAVPAAEKLARLGPAAKDATAALADALKSKDIKLRVVAAEALEAIGPEAEAAIPALIKMLGDRGRIDSNDEFEVWAYAAHALAAIGPAAVKPILEVVDPKGQIVYHAACTALHKMGPAAVEAVPRLIEIVEMKDEDVIPAVFALQGIGPPAKAAVPALITVLDNKNFHAQYFACRALGAIGADAQPAVEKLIERLKNGVTSVRRNAATALGQIGNAGGDALLQALIGALDDPLHPVRIEAIVALGRLGPAAASALPRIKKMLDDPNFVGRSQVAGALYRIDPAEQEFSVSLLLSELQGDNAPWEAAQELGQIAPQANRVGDVIQLLDNAREETREYAADALGQMGQAAKPALEKLEALANDQSQPEDVRSAARDAIVLIAKSM